MKKIAMLAAVVLLICGLVTGCGAGNSVVGTWYSDRDDEAALVLNKAGTYSDGQWLTSGNYTIDGNTVILTGTLDGQNKLKIQTENGKTTLLFGDESYSHTYYGSAEAAQTAREARQAAEQAAAEEQAAKEREALKTALVGYWYNMSSYPVEFTADGKYISYQQGERQESQYELVSGSMLSVTAADGTTEEISAEVQGDGHLQLSTWDYIKATPLDLSLDLLAGEWTDGTLTTVFTADSSYIEKSAFAGFVDDKTVAFTITGSNTLDVPDQGGQQWAFLSETETEYQLLMTKTKNGASYITFMTKAK